MSFLVGTLKDSKKKIRKRLKHNVNACKASYIIEGKENVHLLVYDI